MKRAIASLLAVTFIISNTITYGAINTFKDIPSNFWAKSYISKMNNLGYFKGYPDNTFKPNNNISRIEFMVMLSRVVSNLYKDSIVLTQNDIKDVYTYSDVKNITWALGDYKKVAMYLYLFGEYKESRDKGRQSIMRAFGSKFEPNKNITRAEVVDIIYNLYDKSDIYTGKSTLKDIANHKFKAEIEALESVGVLGGYPDKTFKPDKGITRAEMSKIIDTLIAKKSYLQNVKYSSSKTSSVKYDKYLEPIDAVKTVLTLERAGDYLSAYQYYSEASKKQKGYTDYLSYMKTKLDQASFNVQMYDPKVLEYKEAKIDDNTTKVYFRKYNSVINKPETVKIKKLVMENGKWFVDFEFIPASISDWD